MLASSLLVCLLLSVSYIGICDCVCYLYLSSICFFCPLLITVLCFGSRTWFNEVFAKYQYHLRGMQAIPRLSYGRGLQRRDGAPNRMFLTCLFCHHEMAITNHVSILIIFRLGTFWVFFFYSLTLLIMLAY